MNEELTNEALEAMTKCDETLCGECLAECVCCLDGDIPIAQKLATALLEERARLRVWAYAPDDAIQAQIKWFDKNGSFSGIKTFTRELPKTHIDEIVKETREKIRDYLFAKDGQETIVIDEILKSALKKYAEELEKK